MLNIEFCVLFLHIVKIWTTIRPSYSIPKFFFKNILKNILKNRNNSFKKFRLEESPKLSDKE